MKPPRGPKKGFGGDGDFSGDDDYFNGSNPYVFLLFSFLFACIGWIIYNYGIRNFEKGLADLQKQLENWLAKDPKNKGKRLYAFFLRSLALLMALFTTPEAFARAIAVFGNPVIRNLFRGLRLIARMALVLSIFLGSSIYFLDFYKFLMSYLSPLLDRTINVLSGPQDISLPVLFLEKLIKVQFASLLCSVWIVYFRKSFSKRRLFLSCVCLIGCSLAVYFVLFDFMYLRSLALSLSYQPIVHKLLGCQTGRLLLVMGSVSLLKSFGNFPGISVLYTICVYMLGVFSLAISASPNVFPIK